MPAELRAGIRGGPGRGQGGCPRYSGLSQHRQRERVSAAALLHATPTGDVDEDQPALTVLQSRYIG